MTVSGPYNPQTQNIRRDYMDGVIDTKPGGTMMSERVALPNSDTIGTLVLSTIPFRVRGRITVVEATAVRDAIEFEVQIWRQNDRGQYSRIGGRPVPLLTGDISQYIPGGLAFEPGDFLAWWGKGGPSSIPVTFKEGGPSMHVLPNTPLSVNNVESSEGDRFPRTYALRVRVVEDQQLEQRTHRSASSHKHRPSHDPHGGIDVSDLRDELADLKLAPLKRRARDIDVDERLLERVDESNDPKSAVIELIVRKALQKVSGSAVQAASVDLSPSLKKLIGDWYYGGGAMFKISDVGSGKLRFTENLPGGRETTGILETDASFFVAKLILGDGRYLGHVRLRYNEVKRCLVSNFKHFGHPIWEEDKEASAVDIAQLQEAAAGIQNAWRGRDVRKTAKRLSVNSLTTATFNGRWTIIYQSGSTVPGAWSIKFPKVMYLHGKQAGMEHLVEDVVSTGTELKFKLKDSTGRYDISLRTHLGDRDILHAVQTAWKKGGISTEVLTWRRYRKESEVALWLTQCGLEQHADAFKSNGYDQMEIIRSIAQHPDDIDGLIEDVCMPKGHAKLLRKCLAELNTTFKRDSAAQLLLMDKLSEFGLTIAHLPKIEEERIAVLAQLGFDSALVRARLAKAIEYAQANGKFPVEGEERLRVRAADQLSGAVANGKLSMELRQLVDRRSEGLSPADLEVLRQRAQKQLQDAASNELQLLDLMHNMNKWMLTKRRAKNMLTQAVEDGSLNRVLKSVQHVPLKLQALTDLSQAASHERLLPVLSVAKEREMIRVRARNLLLDAEHHDRLAPALSVAGSLQAAGTQTITADDLKRMGRMNQNQRMNQMNPQAQAAAKIQAAQRGKLARKDMKEKKQAATKLQAAQKQAAMKKEQENLSKATLRLQFGFRVIMARRKATGNKMTFGYIVSVVQARHAAWSKIFDSVCKGKATLQQSAFVTAFRKVHPNYSSSQARALWEGFVTAIPDCDGVDILGFCKIVEAGHIGDEPLAEYADMPVEDWRALGDAGAAKDEAATKIQAIRRGKNARKEIVETANADNIKMKAIQTLALGNADGRFAQLLGMVSNAPVDEHDKGEATF